jgi:prepilin-type N-terminal cleavage/methylation domain-containing protein
MNKRGVTLVELLAALVLFGIVVALVSSILTLITRANKDIQIQTLANSEGNYLKAVIDNELRDYHVTSVESCSTNTTRCIILKSDNQFEYVDSSGNPTLLTYDYQFKIEFSINDELILIKEKKLDTETTYTTITNTIYRINPYFLADEININIDLTLKKLTVIIVLTDEYDRNYVFYILKAFDS